MKIKPVVEVTVDEKWDYEFHGTNLSGSIILASNSLTNLKKEVRERGWVMAWLTCTNGCFSYGQDLIDDYPYYPRY